MLTGLRRLEPAVTPWPKKNEYMGLMSKPFITVQSTLKITA